MISAILKATKAGAAKNPNKKSQKVNHPRRMFAGVWSDFVLQSVATMRRFPNDEKIAKKEFKTHAITFTMSVAEDSKIGAVKYKQVTEDTECGWSRLSKEVPEAFSILSSHEQHYSMWLTKKHTPDFKTS